MQTASYTVNSGGGIALWRGIPAQITISGIEDVSGNWLFLVDNDNADGVILSGAVAASGENLVVTLENMNTVELAAVIQGRDTIQCRATLTDGTSRVFFVPVTVINRAMDGQPPPTPVSEYYTKAQIDAMIAAIPTGTDDYTELTHKPAINGHTLTGDQTAAALGLATPADIPPAQVQADWDESDSSEVTYIQNKPDLSVYMPKSGGTFTGNVDVNGILRLELGKSLVLRPQNAQSAGFSSVVVGTSDCYANYGLTIGIANKLYGQAGIAAGTSCNVSQNYAYAFGIGNRSALSAQTVVGQYNSEDENAYLVVGNGTATDARSNAFVVKKTGDAILAGDLTFTPTGGTPTTLSEVIANVVPKQGDFGAPLSENATVIQLTNALGNIVKYHTAGGIGYITIGSEANASFYTILSGRQTRVTGSISVSVYAPEVNINKVNNALVINVGGKKIYDASTEDFSLPANLEVAGTLTTAGTEIVAATTTIVPQDNKVYQHTLADSEVLTIDTSALTSNHQVQFELHLTQPSSPVAFTLPSNIVWSAGNDFASGNPAPVINSGDTIYCIVLRWTGRRLLGSLAYTEYVGDISDSSSGV